MKLDRTTFPGTLVIGTKNRAWLLTPCWRVKFSMKWNEPLLRRRQWFVHVPFLFVCVDPWEFWG